MQAYTYEPINKAWGSLFLGSYSDALTLATMPAFTRASHFVLAEMAIQNRSGSTAVVGIGGRIKANTTLWKAGQVSAAGAFTDDTTDAQSAAAGDFALGTASANNSGFLVACQFDFNVLSVIVSTAASGGTPAWADNIQYSVAGGSWAALTNLFVAPDFTATGEKLVWWQPPSDWAVMEAGHGTSVPVGYKGLRIRQTTAGTVSAGVATQIIPGMLYYSTEGITDNTIISVMPEGELHLPAYCDAICAAISTANAQNRVTGKYRLAG